MWTCINYHVSVTHYKRPYDTQIAQNTSTLGSVSAPGTSNRDNTVYASVNWVRWWFVAFTWTNGGLLSIGLLGTNFSEIRIRNFTIFKAPGNDMIPAELIKHCKLELLPLITNLLNYIVDKRDFSEIWAEGLRSPVYKCGKTSDTNNYRGITVLSVFTKIFETTVNNRMNFINDAFETTDLFNGGFLEGSKTADNIFILQGLVERQLALGKPLYICMVDFSKAFDLVNRNILFFKLIKAGFHGKVIDTLHSLYRKTVFRVKCKGLLGPPIRDNYGVNQGGNASPMLFRHYMVDLGDYLTKHYGLCIGDDTIVHLLWADDLVLISDSENGLQKQLNGLLSFCANNCMIINELKTKAMVFRAHSGPPNIHINGHPIQTVSQYKYLGNILTATSTLKGDIFRNNHSYIRNKARKAAFGLKHKLKSLGSIPPRTSFYLFETLIRPILLYGSDFWGINSPNNDAIDKVFYQYVRCVLKVKATTSNVMVIGESGQLPPSVFSHISVLSYMGWLQTLPAHTVVKRIYTELFRLHSCGLHNWVTKVLELSKRYGINFNEINSRNFKLECKRAVKTHFESRWVADTQNLPKNPILRSYSLYKHGLYFEPYLDSISDSRYRTALTRLRTSSHVLEIERGRYTVPKTAVGDRLCKICHQIEDEAHFLIDCKLYDNHRQELYVKVSARWTDFILLNSRGKFIFLMSCTDPYILVWLSKFVYKSFNKRAEYLSIKT